MRKSRNSSIASLLTFCAAPVLIYTALAHADSDNRHDHNDRISCVIDSTVGQTGEAGSIDNQKIGRIFTSIGKAPQMSPSVGAWVFFGVTPNTGVNKKACDYFGLQFRFDSGTPDGKALLSTLLYAKAAGKFVDINYCSPAQLGFPVGGTCKDLTEVTIAGAISVRD